MRNKKITSILLTLTVIFTLLISGPAGAITLGVDDFSNLTPDEGTDVTFLAKIDLHGGDAVPLQQITVVITLPDGNTVQDTCTFDLNANTITSCENLAVELVSANYNYCGGDCSESYGYGYDFSDSTTDYQEPNFSYGYERLLGYGYDLFNDGIDPTAEFVFRITWSTPSVGSDTVFNVDLHALADDGDEKVRFETKDSNQITVKNVASTSSSGGSGGGGSSGGGTRLYCGDGVCTVAGAVNEDCSVCAEDCGVCPTTSTTTRRTSTSSSSGSSSGGSGSTRNTTEEEEDSVVVVPPTSPPTVGQATSWFDVATSPFSFLLYILLAGILGWFFFFRGK